MVKCNQQLQKIPQAYLFQELLDKVKKMDASDMIDVTIGDVCKPLTPPVRQAIQASSDTFCAYGPSVGFDALKEAISGVVYGGKFDREEIFISDGAKPDCTNLLRLFSPCSRVLIPDPVYPVFVNASILAGMNDITYAHCSEKTRWLPTPPDVAADIIFLCSPNNPTGTCLDRKSLAAWVDYAKKHQAIILYDNVYAWFIRDENFPKSIYEIEGAREVAIETNSFSKAFGFTGLRCGFSVIPKELKLAHEGVYQSAQSLYRNFRNYTFNGPSYVSQLAAQAALSAEGMQAMREQTDEYLIEAKRIRQYLSKRGYQVFGGQHTPFIWFNIPNCYSSSVECATDLLERFHVAITPGSAFGEAGEGWARISSFLNPETTDQLLDRLESTHAL